MKKQMNVDLQLRVGALALLSILAAACTPMPASQLDVGTPTPAATVAAPMEVPTVVEAIAAPPTPTSAADASLTTPATEEFTEGETPMPANEEAASTETPIRVIFGDTVLTARLWDNAAARDLVAQLPLTLTFSDYGRQEKLATLPQKLTMEGAPAGDDPLPGDITYYAPAGVLVFMYKDIGYFTGIVRLGQFDGGADAIDALIRQTGDFVATIEFVD
jgi:hypothetical protein